jgi:protocatechuate 3,4-dioxygenase beta subunit
MDDQVSGPDDERVMGRRRALTLLGAGVVALAGCGSSDDDTASATTAGDGPASTTGSSGSAESSATTGGSGGTTTAGTCTEIPEETAGPFPGDGSNGPDVLAEDDVVREDIRSSIGRASGVADGVPLTIELLLVDAADGCTPLAGAAVYAWHCDREGNYSMYSDAASGENYLRGVQAADADGRLRFTSIFPGAYSGRWPHVHFEVFSDVDAATGGGTPIATSQLAFPPDACDAVYATEGYEQSVTNMASLSLESDGIFADGYAQQLAAMSGNPDDGFAAALTVAVA